MNCLEAARHRYTLRLLSVAGRGKNTSHSLLLLQANIDPGYAVPGDREDEGR